MAHLYDNDTVNLEIQTLLQAGHSSFSEDTVHSVIAPQPHNVRDEQPWKIKKLAKSVSSSTDRSSFYPWWLKEKSVTRSSESDSSLDSLEEDELKCITVNGGDIGDLPIEYNVEGLKPQEFPVIGTYVDQRICPGFQYRVRLLGSKKYLFKGQALTLRSIGMGYGKRITMEGGSDSHFNNMDHFYSDTHLKGYGFEPVGVLQGDRFVICDQKERPVGKATIDYVDYHNVLKTIVDKETGDVEQQMSVVFVCSVEFESDQHGLMPLCSNKSIDMNGLLCLKRSKRGRKASISAFTDLEVEHYGICSFERFNGL